MDDERKYRGRSSGAVVTTEPEPLDSSQEICPVMVEMTGVMDEVSS